MSRTLFALLVFVSLTSIAAQAGQDLPPASASLLKCKFEYYVKTGDDAGEWVKSIQSVAAPRWPDQQRVLFDDKYFSVAVKVSQNSDGAYIADIWDITANLKDGESAALGMLQAGAMGPAVPANDEKNFRDATRLVVGGLGSDLPYDFGNGIKIKMPQVRCVMVAAD